jgi:hypothetical protein
MNLREIGWEVVDWSHLFQVWDQWRALAKSEESLGSIKGEEFLD